MLCDDLEGWDGEEGGKARQGRDACIIIADLHSCRVSLVALMVKNLPAMQEKQELWVQSLGREDPLEEGMAAHSSILAWRIPWTEEPGRLQSMRSQKSKYPSIMKNKCAH